MPAKDSSLFQRWKRDVIFAGVAGGIVAVSIGVVTIVMGNISGAEARRLVDAVIPTSRLFCSTLMTVSATILALMLTIIGLGSSSETKLADSHYHRVLKLAFYDAVLFGAAAVMFVFHCVPVYESDDIPSWWYSTIYYGLLTVVSTLGGGSVAIIALLYLTVKDMVEVIGLGVKNHQLLADDGGGEE